MSTRENRGGNLKLVRGWEKKYLPQRTGGIRLSKASTYHDVDESEGIGDRREGEIRTPADLTAKIGFREALGQIEGLRDIVSDEEVERLEARAVRELYEHMDDPNAEYIAQGDGSFVVKANPKIDSVNMNGVEVAPYVLCMSREPETKSEWNALRASLPDNYDAWTVTDDLAKLSFEIECGIKRWLALNDVSQHSLRTLKGWVTYEYDEAPDSSWENVGQLAMGERWYRKSLRYQAQREYRVLWQINSPQMPTLPDSIDLELTRTGLSLFKPWDPPSA